MSGISFSNDADIFMVKPICADEGQVHTGAWGRINLLPTNLVNSYGLKVFQPQRRRAARPRPQRAPTSVGRAVAKRSKPAPARLRRRVLRSQVENLLYDPRLELSQARQDSWPPSMSASLAATISIFGSDRRAVLCRPLARPANHPRRRPP